MSENANPVLVIGATGQQGGATARALLARGRAVHAFVRDPDRPAALELRQAGARLVTGDLDDPASLRAAMTDVHGVFLVLNMLSGPTVTAEGVRTEERRGRSVADIAAASGVGQLVYSSVNGADRRTGIPHLESKGRIEAHIRALDLPATILRPVSFMENFHTFTRPALVGGELVVSLALRPDTPMQLIATQDIGELAAIAFDDPGTFAGRRLVIAGDELPAVAVAERFGRAHDVPARFQQVPLERLRAFDPEVARMFEFLDSRQGDRADIEALRAVHPKLQTLTDWLAANSPSLTHAR